MIQQLHDKKRRQQTKRNWPSVVFSLLAAVFAFVAAVFSFHAAGHHSNDHWQLGALLIHHGSFFFGLLAFISMLAAASTLLLRNARNRYSWLAAGTIWTVLVALGLLAGLRSPAAFYIKYTATPNNGAAIEHYRLAFDYAKGKAESRHKTIVQLTEQNPSSGYCKKPSTFDTKGGKAPTNRQLVSCRLLECRVATHINFGGFHYSHSWRLGEHSSPTETDGMDCHNIDPGTARLLYTDSWTRTPGAVSTFGSRFVVGFAHIVHLHETKSGAPKVESHYVDARGDKAFDYIIKGHFAQATENRREKGAGKLPAHFVVVSKNGSRGVLTTQGQWLVEPHYDKIDEVSGYGWVLHAKDKVALMGANGNISTTQFSKALHLKGPYFVVRRNEHWGVYDVDANKLTVPIKYAHFAYCGQCTTLPDYLFATTSGLKSPKWGVIDFHDKTLVPFNYQRLHDPKLSGDWIYNLGHNGKAIAINVRTGKTGVTGVSTDAVVYPGFQLVRKDGHVGLMDAAGHEVLPAIYDYIGYKATYINQQESTLLFKITRNDRAGIADGHGKILLKPVYSYVDTFPKGYLEAQLPNHKRRFFNMDGTRAVPFDYDLLQYQPVTLKSGKKTFIYQIRSGADGDKFGFFHPPAGTIVKPAYDYLLTKQYAHYFPHSIGVSKNGKRGIIDLQTGRYIVPLQSSHLRKIRTSHLPNGLAILTLGHRDRLYDYHHHRYLPPASFRLIALGDGLLAFDNDTAMGIMTLDGKIRVPARYQKIKPLGNKLYALEDASGGYRNISYHFYDADSHNSFTSLKGTVEWAGDASHAILKTDAGYKLYNPARQKIITGPYSANGFPDHLVYLGHGLARANYGTKVGLIHLDGKVATPAHYSYISTFHHGVALARTADGQYGYLGGNGNLLVAATYDYNDQLDADNYFAGHYLLLSKTKKTKYGDSDKLQGLASRKGKVILPPQYDRILLQKNGSHFLIRQHGLYGVANTDGKVIIPPSLVSVRLDRSAMPDSPFRSFHMPIMGKLRHDDTYYHYASEAKDGKLDIQVDRLIPFAL